MKQDSAFLEHAVRLDDPTAEAVRDAFTALPRRGSLACVCRWERRLEILSALEESGAFAVRFEPFDGFSRARVSALKGKSGPCYDTGRRAAYRGDAAAALDDDNHLIVGEIRVCEKTGGLYTLAPYRDALSVTAADPALLARLDSDPVPFDCNTFDADSGRLCSEVRKSGRAEAAECACAACACGAPGEEPGGEPGGADEGVAVVYPGPFRALVLADGSVVRRGVATVVAAEQAGRNGLLRLPPACAAEARPCEHYAAASRARGAAFILEPLAAGRAKKGAGFAEPKALDSRALGALRAAPGDVKRRLLQVIDAGEPYWVLTGSDPAVEGGCCPSTTVGAANRLVAAGALQAYEPPAPPEACTATFYAFPGEIAAEAEGEPDFRILEEIRRQAAEALRDGRRDGVKSAARVGALAVLGASLGVTVWQMLGQAAMLRESRLCAVCETAVRLTHRVAESGLAGLTGALSLGALAAVQPCALALLVATLAVVWRVGSGTGTNALRCGAVAAGLGLFTCVAVIGAAWGASRMLGDVADNVRTFRGPLLVAAGLPLTGLFRLPTGHAAVNARGRAWGLFAWGVGFGALACPVSVGLFAGVVLPSALARGTPVHAALLYGAGYAGMLAALSLLAVAGGRLAGLHAFGRRAGWVAGWGLIGVGAVSAVAGF